MPRLVSQRRALETVSLRFGRIELDRRHDEEHAQEHGEAGEPVALAEKTVHGSETSRSGAGL